LSTEKTVKVLTEKVQVQDSVIKDNIEVIAEKNTVIEEKTNEVKEIKENSIPVGNGNGVYILIAIGGVLLIVFFVTMYKKSIGAYIGKYVSLTETDLIKGTVIAFLMAFLTGLYSIINTGVFPTDWPTWRMLLIVSFSAGVAYLLKNILTPTKDAKIEGKPKE
jgi:hypothetical protein